ncbi:hypothetical protein GBAR_LOCUS11281 [Geodia barretti]|uniref:Uncharacterized protein n=1 Tax=Geodia barretti TaxID=519541 RepID=A0AA35WLT0_GEOBA|nr:hypothetical protein GBAR_LOCUS11281 [Geodia barretti]
MLDSVTPRTSRLHLVDVFDVQKAKKSYYSDACDNP